MKDALSILREGTVIPALPLVLNAERQLDEKRQRRLVRYYLEAGAGGLAVAVHTTQFEIRENGIDLFLPILTIAQEEVAAFESRTEKNIVLVAGVCGETQQALQEAALAKKLGYHAVLISPGGLNHKSEEYLLERTAKIADLIPVIGFYLQPAVGGRAFTYQYWQQFTEIENVVAIKAAPFDRYLTLDVARAVAFSSRKNQITLYTGNDDTLLYDLLTPFVFEENGEKHTVCFRGGLLGHWAVWTHQAINYFQDAKQAVKTGEIPAGLLTLAAQITDANSAFFDSRNGFAGCIVGIHEVLRRQGLLEYVHTLNPAEGLTPGQKDEIERVYRMYPHLNDDQFVREFLLADAENQK